MSCTHSQQILGKQGIQPASLESIGNHTAANTQAPLCTGVVSTRGCGKFEMYSNAAPEACFLDGQEIQHQYHKESCRLFVDLPLADYLQRELEVKF